MKSFSSNNESKIMIRMLKRNQIGEVHFSLYTNLTEPGEDMMNINHSLQIMEMVNIYCVKSTKRSSSKMRPLR